MKAWKQTEESRPDIETLLSCVGAYRNFLYERSLRDKKEYPKCHAATWLRQERWDSWLPEDPVPAAVAEVGSGPKDPKLRQLRDVLTPAVYDLWFQGAVLSGEVVTVPRKIQADRISTKYYSALDAIFGGGWTVSHKTENLEGDGNEN